MARFLDKVIASLRSLYLAIVSFVLIYAFVSISLFEHNQGILKLVVLDKLLALRSVAKPAHPFTEKKGTLKDMPNYFGHAQDDILGKLQRIEEKLDKDFDSATNEAESDSADSNRPRSDDDSSNEELKQFEKPIDWVNILKDVPMRLSVGAVCDILVVQLLPGHVFTFATLQVVGDFYSVKSENTRLISFGRCAPGQPKEFNAFIFSLPDGQVVFALPQSTAEQFPGLIPQLPFKPYTLQDVDTAKKFLPPAIAMYPKLDEPFVTLHIRAIDYFILNYADARLGRFFRADEIEDAAGKLYEEKEKDASYFGITATSTLLVRFGPFIYFALSFELWRRVRLLPIRKIRSDEYWFAFEARDWVGLIYAYLCCAAPLLFGIMVYVLFSVSQGLTQPMFGYDLSLQGLVEFKFPPSAPEGWIVRDHFASLVGLILVPIHFLILFLTAQKLIRVVKANSLPGSK